MEASRIYIAIAIVALAVILALLFFIPGISRRLKLKGRDKNLTPLAGLAFGFIVAGILFSTEKWLGYGLLGIGVILAIIDIIIYSREKKRSINTY